MKNNKFYFTLFILVFSKNTSYSSENITTTEPDEVNYVRVCDTYGKGYFTLPGTKTCMAIGGYVRSTTQVGHDPSDNTSYHSPSNSVRFTLTPKTAFETELGTLKTEASLRFQWDDGKDSKGTGTLRKGVIQLGGLELGLGSSAFISFSDDLGDIINDDVIAYGGSRTALISYKYKHSNGFSAILSFEQGNNKDVGYNTKKDDDTSLINGGTITGYMPHVVIGAKYEQGGNTFTAVTAYDSVNETWASKAKLVLKTSDRLSFWAQGAYKNNGDVYFEGKRQKTSFYGQWGGNWATWGGSEYKLNSKTNLNVQLAYDASRTFATSANFKYEMIPGLIIQPEISYTRWNDRKATSLYKQNAIGGALQIQRTF